MLLKKASEMGLYCLPFHLHRLNALVRVNPQCSDFRTITAISVCLKILDFLL